MREIDWEGEGRERRIGKEGKEEWKIDERREQRIGEGGIGREREKGGEEEERRERKKRRRKGREEYSIRYNI